MNDGHVRADVGEVDRVTVAVALPHLRRRRRRLQVEVEHPQGRRVPFRVGGGEVRGVLAEQVVQPEPAGDGFVEQVRVDELREQRVGVAGRQAGERRGDPHRQFPGGVHAEEPEQPLRGRGQLPVGQFERRLRGPAVDGEVDGGGVGAAQPVGEVGDAPRRAVREPGRGEPQREGQVPAEAGDLGGRGRVGGGAGPDDRGDQPAATRPRTARPGTRAGPRRDRRCGGGW